AVLLQPGIASVADHAQQPGATFAAVEAVEEPIRPQVRFLHQVLRVVIVAGQPAGQVERGVEVRQHGLLKADAPVVLWQRAPPRAQPDSWARCETPDVLPSPLGKNEDSLI